MTLHADSALFKLNHIARIRSLRLIAIVPVLLAAVWNTGAQYLIALDLTEGDEPIGWRDRIIASRVTSVEDPGLWEIIFAGMVHVLPVVVAALLTAGVWERIFAAGRDRVFDSGFIFIALVYAMFMHPSVSLLHLVFGLSFGMVFARGIFGGEGRSFLSPALVGVAIVQISFPAALTDHPIWTELNGYAGTHSLLVAYQQGLDALQWNGSGWWQVALGDTQGLLGTTSLIAVSIGAALLVFARVASLPLIGAHIVGLILGVLILGGFTDGGGAVPWYWHLVLGSFIFGVVFLATDPASSCVTNTGRWIQGIIAGVLIVLLRVVNPSHPDSVVPVLLLVSMLAPLIDHGVIWMNIRQRGRLHGG